MQIVKKIIMYKTLSFGFPANKIKGKLKQSIRYKIWKKKNSNKILTLRKNVRCTRSFFFLKAMTQKSKLAFQIIWTDFIRDWHRILIQTANIWFTFTKKFCLKEEMSAIFVWVLYSLFCIVKWLKVSPAIVPHSHIITMK